VIRYIESKSTAGVFYRVDLARRECTCTAAKFGSRCSHVRLGDEQLSKTRLAEVEDRRGELHARMTDLLDELRLEPSDALLIATAIADEHDSATEGRDPFAPPKR
jgi:hypothetical protein